MTILECIDGYVKGIQTGIAILTDDIYDYVAARIPEVQRNAVNTNIARYAKAHPCFVRYQKGIYYLAKMTPFGRTKIKYSELIRRKYLVDGDRIIGYETGPSYMNKLGLTTQMSSQIYLATEHASETEGEDVVLVKPVTRIDNGNYRYLQFLDVLDNRMKVHIEAENYRDILREYIDTHKLNFEKLMYYARFYRSNNVYRGIAELARSI